MARGRSDSRPRRRSNSRRRDSRRRSPQRRSPQRRSPQRRSPPRRSPLRRRTPSRSRSPPRRSQRSPKPSPKRSPVKDVKAAAPSSGDLPDDVGKAEVVAGKPRPSTGEPTWRAEIMMPQVGLTERTGGNSYGGKVRTMCIRGPHRVDKSQAEEDAEKLGAAAKDGDTRAVKAIANDMVRHGRVP
eukprot:s1816_g4.t1